MYIIIIYMRAPCRAYSNEPLKRGGGGNAEAFLVVNAGSITVL